MGQVMQPRRLAVGPLNLRPRLTVAHLIASTLPVCSPASSKLLYKHDSSRPFRRAFRRPPQRILTETRELSSSATKHAAENSIDTVCLPSPPLACYETSTIMLDSIAFTDNFACRLLHLAVVRSKASRSSRRKPLVTMGKYQSRMCRQKISRSTLERSPCSC